MYLSRANQENIARHLGLGGIPGLLIIANSAIRTFCVLSDLNTCSHLSFVIAQRACCIIIIIIPILQINTLRLVRQMVRVPGIEFRTVLLQIACSEINSQYTEQSQASLLILTVCMKVNEESSKSNGDFHIFCFCFCLFFFLRGSFAFVTQAGVQWHNLGSPQPPLLGSGNSPASAS